MQDAPPLVSFCGRGGVRRGGFPQPVPAAVKGGAERDKMKMMCRIAGCVIAAVAGLFAIAGEAPKIEKRMPADGKRDVKIHFYVDAHRRNRDSNMRKETSGAYLRAINALRNILTDRDNPIDAGLRMRGFGRNAEVNTGTAYLLKPDGVAPVSLSRPAKESDFGRFAEEEGARDKGVLVQTILDNEKTSQNVVVCVISNDPDLSARHGCFHMEEKSGIMFFMLHAPRESVNAGFFQRYWKVEEWERFLRDAMGENANDIANAIVDSYYSLGAEGEKALAALVCEPKDDTIRVEMIRSLRRKPMWKIELAHNGKEIPLDRDVQELVPTSGQNKITAKIVSPAGLEYTREWEHSGLEYFRVKDNEKLASKIEEVRAALEGLKDRGASIEQLKRIKEPIDKINVEQPLVKDKIDEIAGTVKRMSEELERIKNELDRKKWKERFERERTNLISDIKKYREKIEKEKDAQKLECTNLKGLDDIARKAQATTGIKEVEETRAEFKKWKPEYKPIVNWPELQKKLIAEIEGRRENVKAEEAEKEFVCTNMGDLDRIEEKARAAKGVNDVSEAKRRFENWKPDYKPDGNVALRQKLIEKIEGIKKSVREHEATNEVVSTNMNELIETEGIVRSAKGVDAISAAESRIEKWMPKCKSDSNGPLRQKLTRDIAGKLANPDHCVKNIENRGELEELKERVAKEMTMAGLERLKNDVAKWKPKWKGELSKGEGKPRNGGGLLWLVLGAGAIAFGAWFGLRLMAPKTVGVVSYQARGDAETPRRHELKEGRTVRFTEVFECTLNVKCTAKKNESGEVEFELVSSDKTVWLKKQGVTARKPVGETAATFEAGEYQIFDAEVALQHVANLEFEAQ